MHETHRTAEHDVADHRHGEGCGHRTVPHTDHVDYEHEGHLHHEHEGHYDEHVASTPAGSDR